MKIRKQYDNEAAEILSLNETHYTDFKSARIKPAKAQESFVAFANADGGVIYIGIEDPEAAGERIAGYKKEEDANDIITTLLEQTKPAVENVEFEFIDFEARGLILKIDIPKSPRIHYTASDDCYMRLNAMSRKIKGERISELGYAKGSFSYEKVFVDGVDLDILLKSAYLKNYLSRIKTKQEPLEFLRKQRLVGRKDGGDLAPTVAAVLLFDENPQAALNTRCAVKVYRLLTSEEGYKREQLASDPITISGPIELQIKEAIRAVSDLLKGATFSTKTGLDKLKYPSDAIHEVLVNAAIHRDYSLNDDIHIRIYDNRIEVLSPGRLPGYITPANIYKERFSRNPAIVRLLHTLPNPLNKDIGEGLDTVRNELKKAGLVAPTIAEQDNSVVITIKHQRVESLVDVIKAFFIQNPDGEITNSTIRELSGEDDVKKVKKALQKLRANGDIEPVDANADAFDFKYRKKK